MSYSDESAIPWHKADEGDVHTHVMPYVAEVERTQSYLFERFYRLAALYDPYFAYRSGDGFGDAGNLSGRGGDNVSENVIASNVDTVTAIVAATEVRPRFMTDGASWSAQRNAKHLGWYAEGLAKLLGIHDAAVAAFKDAALKGTGLVKVYVDWASKKIKVERVLVDDIIVDEGEVRTGSPRQMHQRVFVDRDELKAAFPKHADAIEAQDETQDTGSWSYLWAEYRAVRRSQSVLIESWHLPIGKYGSDNYQPGRHTICIHGHDLLDEEWHKPRFPFARMVWTERASGWYGIGGGERIAGHQRRVNKLNWQTDRQQDQLAVPTTFVRLADANLAVKTTTRAGSVVPYKAELPQTVIPQAVSPETYARLEKVKAGAFEEFGVSQVAATARKPAGLDSGVALREYRDMTTQRWSRQEKAFESIVLDLFWLGVDAAKDLGKDAPRVYRFTRFGEKQVDWSKVDMEELKVQIAAASMLSRTPAGRMQLVLEFAQAGMISQDEARRLSGHPDLEAALSRYTAALEDIERCIEEALDGHVLVPEPFQDLKMGIWRYSAALLKANGDGAPEEILEILRQWISQAAYILSLGYDAADVQPEGTTPTYEQTQAQSSPNFAMPQSALAAELAGPSAGAIG
jgi:hypothetical protein